MYLTRASLRDYTSDLELSQVASPRETAPISATKMRDAINGIDFSADPEHAKIQSALDRIDRVIVDAQGLVDGYLVARYSPVPLTTVPQALFNATADVARYMLNNVRTTDEIRQRYQDALKWLEQVALGIYVLDVSGTDTPLIESTQVDGGSDIYSVHGFALQSYARPYGLG